jgi:FkbM family methyltransferase
MSEERSQYRVIQVGNPFEDARLQLAPREIETVMDVGANVGDVCQHLLANFLKARIFALEPDAECYDQLVSRFADESRILPAKLGLSERLERRMLFRYAESGLNAFSALADSSGKFLDGYGVQPAAAQEVELATLDAYCQEHAIEHIDFLKLDVQGWELPCLRGSLELLKASRISAIYAEVNFVKLYEEQDYFEDVSRFLRDYGFQLFSLYALSFNEVGQLCWADALFLRNPEMSIVEPPPPPKTLMERYLPWLKRRV